MMKKFDVIVCGGGPSGVCAALRAAREGMSVLLIEKNGCLGGVWTSGMVSWFLDVAGKEGIIREIIGLLSENGGGRFARGGNFLCEPESIKYLLETLCLEAGVRVRLYTLITGCDVRGREILSVRTHSKSGEEHFQGRFFIDATGDGDIGYFSGCRYEIGLQSGRVQQPMSLIALVNGLRHDDLKEYDNSEEQLSGIGAKRMLFEAMEKAGVKPSQAVPALYYLSNDLYLLTVTHEYGYDAENADDLTQATLIARSEIHHTIEALRKQGGIWKDMRVVTTAETIGVRDSRRILGVKSVNREDVLESKRCSDEICLSHFPIDVHAVSPENTSGYSYIGKTNGYGIPAGALIAEDIDNLLMAGKCISGDFYAQASYRVTGNASVTGEQAGAMAARCIKLSLHIVRDVLPFYG